MLDYWSLHSHRFASGRAVLSRVTLAFLWKLSRPFVCFSSGFFFFFFSGLLCCWRSPCLLQPPLWTLYSDNLCSLALETFLGAGLAPHSPTAQGLPAGERPEEWKAWSGGTLWKASAFSPTVTAQSKVWSLWWMSSWGIDAFFHAVSPEFMHLLEWPLVMPISFTSFLNGKASFEKETLLPLMQCKPPTEPLEQSQDCWGPCVYFPRDH